MTVEEQGGTTEVEQIGSVTSDLTEENVQKLIELFPDVATEVRDPVTGEVVKGVNPEALLDRIGKTAGGGYPVARERYQFTWPGKRAAKAEARTPIAKTLRPVQQRSKNWDETKNLYIEGDNLDALKILRETYAGKIKMIYIDPPYNTGHDFIYKDDFAKTVDADKAESGDYDEDGGRLVANPESNGRFHSDWCSMMYSRLLLARDLLTSDGFIFISIDSHELGNLQKIADEIFGASNRRNCIAVRRGIKNVQAQFDDLGALAQGHEYILLYSKVPSSRIAKLSLAHEGKPGKWDTFWRGTDRPTMRYELFGVTPENGQWRWSESRTIEAIQNYDFYLRESELPLDEYYLNHLTATNEKLNFVRKNAEGTVQYFVPPSTGKLLSDNWMDLTISGNETDYFDTEKSVALLKRIIGWITEHDRSSIILDFFSGSATTAEAVMQLNVEDSGNRKFMMVQLPESVQKSNGSNQSEYDTICEVGEERIRQAGEKIKRSVEMKNQQLALDGEQQIVPDIGFRVLRIESSNYEDVRLTPENFTQDDLDASIENEKQGRTPLDLLFEALPSFQLEYSSSIAILTGGHSMATPYSA
jgi:adenine-specific DNA-methyltransferase